MHISNLDNLARSDSAWDRAPTPITELLLGLGHLDEWSGEDATGHADAAQGGGTYARWHKAIVRHASSRPALQLSFLRKQIVSVRCCRPTPRSM